MIDIPLFPASPSLYEAATQLAAAFHLPFVDNLSPTLPLLLYLTENRLELHDRRSSAKPLYVDFTNGTLDYRRRHGGGRRQSLGRAVGLKYGVNPVVVDATAGLGRDAFILACLGCQVYMIERSPVVAALLYDGLQRARQHLQLQALIGENLQLVHGDAKHWLSSLSTKLKPDVIYLDPMYPPRQKSALVKKEMQLLHTIIGDDVDASSLLQMAMRCARHRVVVKRPRLALTLDNTPSTLRIESKNTRFDVYLVRERSYTQSINAI